MKTLDMKLLFENWNRIFNQNVDHLTKLDGVAGDADLGIVMSDGFSAVNEMISQNDEADVGKLFYKVGKTFNNAAPSSMGTLLSAGFMNIGKRLKGEPVITETNTIEIVRGMAEGVQHVGKANEGEKTFLDAIFPALRAMEEHIGKAISEVMSAAYEASEQGVERATNMQAKHGRIAFKQEQSIGIIDPGSVVASLFIKGLQVTWEGDCYEE